MTFTWQQSRNETLYVEGESKRIYSILRWHNENRLCIEAQYVGPGERLELGFWFDETAARNAVESYVARQLPKKAEKGA